MPPKARFCRVYRADCLSPAPDLQTTPGQKFHRLCWRSKPATVAWSDRHVFTVAIEEWELPSLEIRSRLRLGSADVQRKRRLRLGEEERLINGASCCRNPRNSPGHRLALEAGMRRGEIIGIKSERMEAKGSALLLPEIKERSRATTHSRPR